MGDAESGLAEREGVGGGERNKARGEGGREDGTQERVEGALIMIVARPAIGRRYGGRRTHG